MADIFSLTENGFLTTLHTFVSVEKEQLVAKYIASVGFEVQIMAWRDNPYSKHLHMAAFIGKGQKILAANNWLLNVSADYAADCWGYLPGKSQTFKVLVHGTIAGNGDINAPIVGKSDSCAYDYDNSDKPVDGLVLLGKPVLYSKGHLNSNIQMDGNWADGYAPQDWYNVNIQFAYPPMKTFGNGKGSDDDYSNNGSDSTNGIDIGTGGEQLSISSSYSITRAANTTQSVSWSPNGTSGTDGLTIKNECKVEHVGTGNSSPYSFTTPDIIGSSYTAWVKRYYTDYTNVQARSKTITLYTYSKPTLSSITLSKTVISPRAEESLRITLNGMNNKTWGIENNFRTGIWSNIKAKYYIDETNTNSYRDLSVDNIKTMFPDTSAVNGVVNGVVKVNRRNLGVSGGNPGSGQLVYETDTRTQNITIKYTPTKPIDPNKEPNNDPSNSGLRYNKRENNIQGAKLTAGHTWVLPNTYNIGTMTGVDVTIQYPKTDDAGVLNGYRIRLISANDGSPHANETYYEHHYDTTDYTKTFTIPYDIIRRGVSGNIIEITPYYKPSTGGYWYGPTITKKFVDIAWMLGDPVIDCPLTGTTWHNHQYRVLFKLPIDRDTNYKGQNDIEFYYGAGTYRYQEIQIDINGTITTIGNNAYMNAQNSWNSPVNINNAKLTYLRNIIINQSLIPTYKVDDYYFIKIRVRKAYGQNPNWDGWSNWSQPITVGRKTVSNTNVVRHETIMASHYMNVQDAFNKCTACYAKTASNNQNFVVQESFDRKRGDNINGPHLSPPSNTPFKTIREYVSEFNDLHQLKNKINSYGTFDTDKDRSKVKLDYQNKLLATFVPSQEFITAEKDQNGATECDSPSTILKGRNYMKYMCDELNNLW